MPKFANFVQVTLVSAITAGGLVIEVEAQAPFNLPPDPAGEKAYLTLMDNVNNPTAFEIISYTGTNPTGPTTVELTGVTRAEQGTTAQAWDAGAVGRQDLTGANLAIFDDVLRNRDFYVLCGQDSSVRVIGADGVAIWEVFVQEDGIKAGAVGVNGDVAIAFSDGGLVKFDRFGERVWSSSDTSAETVTMAVASDGSVFAVENLGPALRYTPEGVGTSIGSSKSPILGIIDGDVLFTKDGGVSIADQDLNAVLTDGSSAVSKGESRGSEIAYVTFDDIRTMDANGNVTVLATVDPNWFTPDSGTPAGLEIRNIAALPDGSVAGEVLLSTTGGDTSTENHTFLVDNDGNVVWTKAFNSTYFDSPAFAFDNFDFNDIMSAGNALVVSQLFGESGNFATKFAGVDALTGERTWGPQTINTRFDVQLSGPNSAAPIFYDGSASRLRFPRNDEVVEASVTSLRRFSETALDIGTPPTGKAYVFLDAADGAYKVKFDDGTVTTIAAPPP